MELKTIPTTMRGETELGPNLGENIVSKGELKALRRDQSFLQAWDSGKKAGAIAADLEQSVRETQAREKLRAYKVVMRDSTELLIGKHKQRVGAEFAAMEQGNRVSADLALERTVEYAVHARTQLEDARATDLDRLEQQGIAGKVRPEQVEPVRAYLNNANNFIGTLQQDGFVNSAQKTKQFYDGATAHPNSPDKE